MHTACSSGPKHEHIVHVSAEAKTGAMHPTAGRANIAGFSSNVLHYPSFLAACSHAPLACWRPAFSRPPAMLLILLHSWSSHLEDPEHTQLPAHGAAVGAPRPAFVTVAFVGDRGLLAARRATCECPLACCRVKLSSQGEVAAASLRVLPRAREVQLALQRLASKCQGEAQLPHGFPPQRVLLQRHVPRCTCLAAVRCCSGGRGGGGEGYLGHSRRLSPQAHKRPGRLLHHSRQRLLPIQLV
mmetsp:Transcript_4082/g.10216  ORF Transcript_4082/g.10216 Transcript_4082/m.10216 type:complete len:242 (-) Transcript_4082:276-1001(-)